jgi:DNA-binding transcriptional LysR family regulator
MSHELDSELLRTFIAIVDTGSFTNAAAVVNRTQSAVSMQMKRLELVTGDTIFNRDGRNVKLTSHGETLQRYARRILKMHAEALSALKQTQCKGKITIGIPDDFIETVLPVFLKKLSQEYPFVEVNVVCLGSDILRKMLDKKELDLAILGREPHSISPGEIQLRRESAVWVASKSSIAYEQDPLPLATFGSHCMFHDWAIDALDNANRAHRITYSSRSLGGLLAYIRTGIGVTVLAESSVTNEFRILDLQDDFPLLPDLAIVLARAPANTSMLIDTVEQEIISCFGRVKEY